jgi:hypothetical protein
MNVFKDGVMISRENRIRATKSTQIRIRQRQIITWKTLLGYLIFEISLRVSGSLLTELRNTDLGYACVYIRNVAAEVCVVFILKSEFRNGREARI